VPLLIGLNWSMLVFAIGASAHGPVVHAHLGQGDAEQRHDGGLGRTDRTRGHAPGLSGRGRRMSIPLRNYIAWGVVSAFYFALFFTLPVKRENPTSRPLSCSVAQLCFFAGIIMVSAARRSAWNASTYLALDLFTLSFPLIRSFEPRMQYWRKWRASSPASW
jgi:hypothetical protein